MATATKLCVNCKTRRRNEEMKQTPNKQWFCDAECVANYAYKRIVKSNAQSTQKKHAKEKRDYQLSDKKIRKAAAVRECHAYIKRRDMGKPCITCNREMTGKYDSGHFLKAGSHSYTMFMEKNIHSQCVNCNQYNGGKEKEYRMALILMYGLRTVEAMERVRNRKVLRSADDYLAIENYYKNKLN